MIEKCSSSLGRKDEAPNIAVAIELCQSENRNGIAEIINGLNSDSSALANDCIKVLYEIGFRKPVLIANNVETFVTLLRSKNNRLVWGAMTALSTIASLKPNTLFKHIDTIIDAYKKGSVITVDVSITVFANLIKVNAVMAQKLFPILMNHIATCRPKEVGQHAERIFICITENNASQFSDILKKRYPVLTPQQKKRVDKLLKQINAY